MTNKDNADIEKYINDTVMLSKVEALQEYRKWADQIPFIKFPPNWQVKVIPPTSGAIVRFLVLANGHKYSIYLDCYDRLGCFGSPYWELYPYQGDVARFRIENAQEIVDHIREDLEGK